MSKPIVTPQELADEWKRSGGLDQTRQAIITDFLASSQKNTILTRLDTILPTILLRPSLKHRKEKDKRKLHAEIMGLVESNYSIIQGSAKEVERGITLGGPAGERGRGIAEELGVLLRGSRGEYVKDVVLVEEGVEGQFLWKRLLLLSRTDCCFFS